MYFLHIKFLVSFRVYIVLVLNISVQVYFFPSICSKIMIIRRIFVYFLALKIMCQGIQNSAERLIRDQRNKQKIVMTAGVQDVDLFC